MANILFASNRSGIRDLYLKESDGSGEDRLILKTDRDKTPTSWSPNGFLMFQSGKNGTGGDLWVLPHPESGSSQPVPYLQTPADEFTGQFSPDGKWVYVTNLISNDVSVIDAVSDTEVARIPVGKTPNGITWWRGE